jgi:hypothetical protein
VAASTYAPYSLPNSAAAAGGLRDLQTQAVGGLSTLMGQDYDAERQQFQDSLYAAQEEPLTRAMEDQLNRLVEGQFGKGMGGSTRTENMVGETNQQYFDALTRAGREAYLGAGAENRADLAARQGLYTGGFNAGTQGLQAEANVGLANAQNQQQAAQFGQNLDQQRYLQSQQLAQQQGQFDAQMQQNYAQLAQQASQFGATLDYNTQQALMNRAQQMTLAQMQDTLGRDQMAQQNNQFGQTLGFQNQQLNQQNDQFGRTLGFQNQQLNQQNDQFGRTLGFQNQQLNQNNDQFGRTLGFQNQQLGQQNNQFTSQQDLQRQLAANSLALQYAQLGQQNDQFNKGLDQRAGAQSSAALGAGLTGLAGLFAPTINAGGNAVNDFLMNLLGVQPGGTSGLSADDLIAALGGVRS